ncbi:hypothetical protein J4471_00030 [Candidatus Woesearchaeota archaeon]|nr:hypothetical protein [Candidatus Woesearchaeota archaeon]
MTKDTKISNIGHKSISVIVLILVNSVAAYAVITNNLNSASLLLAYWLESLFFLIFVILKARKVEKFGPYYNNPRRSKNYIIKAFAKSYIFILFFYLFFILGWIFIPLGTTISGSDLATKVKLSLNYNTLVSIMVLAIAFIASHTLSYKLNFIKYKEYKKTTLYDVMHSPWQRVIIIHAVIVFGMLIKAPDLFLVLVKTLVDIYGHLNERKKQGSIETNF